MAYTTINKSTDHFNTKLYTGTGSSQVLTGIGFSPDLIWTATRNESEIKPMNDSVNGINNYIRSNANDTLETTGSNITAQSSDGYTVGTEDRFNQNSNTFCSWNWKANGLGSSNTDGSINTTYTSANTTAGFSIIKYAGTGNSGTIGHGLSATPKVCFFKEIDGLESWRVWHRAAPNYSTKALKLNGNDAEFSQTNWVGTVDNSIITIGSDSSINTSGNNYICYAFAEKTGYSKFGSYTGNGNADGTFIYTGFKPAWVMVKRTDSTNNWMIIDNKRTPSNTGTVPEIFADSNSAENNSTDGRFDYLSNGLKARGTNAVINASGGTYLYMAFAEAPLVGQNNVPATAR